MTESKPRLVVQAGPTGTSAGGMQSVLRTYAELQVRGYRMTTLSTFSEEAGLHSLFRALRSGGQLLVRRRRVSVLHAHVSHGGSFLREGALVILARALRLPCVLTVHGSDFVEFSHKHPRLVRIVLSTVDRVISLNDETTRRLSQLATTPVVTVANPVQVPASAAPVGSSSPTVFFAGSVGERKGVDVLLAAWKLLQQRQVQGELRIAGPLDGTLPTSEFAAPQLRMLGNLSNEQVQLELRAARVAVLPSRREAMPVFLLEAMAQGIPIVVTPVGGMPSLAAGCGRVVPLNDAEALGTALSEYLEDSESASVDGLAGRRKVEQGYSTTIVAGMLAALYDELLQSDRDN